MTELTESLLTVARADANALELELRHRLNETVSEAVRQSYPCGISRRYRNAVALPQRDRFADGPPTLVSFKSMTEVQFQGVRVGPCDRQNDLRQFRHTLPST